MDLATTALFVSEQTEVLNGKLANISYEAGDYFSLQVSNNDFVSLDLSVESFAAPGLGFAQTGPIESGLTKAAYYRFEETSGVEVLDTRSGEVHGTFEGVPGDPRSTDVPFTTVPQTGEANNFSADIRQGGHVLLDKSEFILNGSTSGEGQDGDATLEWFMKIPNDFSPDIAGPNGHTSIFWTNGTGADSNRYNIFWDAHWTGAPDSDRFVSGDFRSDLTGGGTTNITAPGHNTGLPIEEDVWNHFAITRTDNTPDNKGDFNFTWNWFVNGVKNDAQTATSTGPTPTDVSSGWTIAGRQGFDFYGLLDEIRMSDSVLTPDQFLNAEGSGGGLAGDYNGNGTVDAADYVVWRDSFGQSVTAGTGADGNADGTINELDYATWKLNFGNSAGSGSAAIPEPATFLLLLAGLAGMVACRRQ